MKLILTLLALCAASLPARADEPVLVAVATNFTGAMAVIEPAFEAAHPCDLRITAGSTGKLYAQIRNGAPFAVFLAADRARPERLLAEGVAVAGSGFTYAIGALSLWSPDADLLQAGGPEVLRAAQFDHLALANPDLAPYGAAAAEALQRLGLYHALIDRMVMGQNVGQTFALVATGNAELGFVAQSLIVDQPGSRWDVPADLHAPLRQDAVLLQAGAGNVCARDFVDYLKSDAARDLIAPLGYRFEE